MSDILTILALAAALALDAITVSVANGICVSEMSLYHAIRAASFFGVFQFAMPLAGWLIGGTFKSYVTAFAPWIACGLLAIVGGKMIKESFGTKDPASCSDDEKSRSDIRDLRTLLVLAIATSIDALAVGLSYSVMNKPILFPAAVIGVVTFALSIAGIEFGKRVGARFERWATLVGGLVLIGIGVKALF
jgi:putative Mn2+ efflux pump MntP